MYVLVTQPTVVAFVSDQTMDGIPEIGGEDLNKLYFNRTLNLHLDRVPASSDDIDEVRNLELLS